MPFIVIQRKLASISQSNIAINGGADGTQFYEYTLGVTFLVPLQSTTPFNLGVSMRISDNINE